MDHSSQMPAWHGTTILSVRKGDTVVVAGDGQVSMQNVIIKSNARKVRRLGEITKAGEVIVVPGKILGTGSLGHKLTVCAFSISEGAAKKVTTAGGKVVSFEDLIKKHPDGKGVRVIG